MKANNGSIVATIIVCAVLLAGLIVFATPAPVEVPTAAAIAALVVIPEPVAPVDNSADIAIILDAVAWKSEDISNTDKNAAISLSDEIDEDDFLELVADGLGMDDDYLEIIRVDEKDIEVTAESEDAADDGNFKVEEFLRIVYRDTDLDENEVAYVVVTADITDVYDNDNDQDVDYSIEEVSRNFGFD